MPNIVVATPNILVDPGYLFMAPVGTAMPTNTAAAGKFSDALPAAYIPLGATTEGSEFTYSSQVEPILAAEFFDPIRFATVSRSGSITFSLLNYTLTNLRRALNGGIAAMVTTGVAGSERATFSPPAPGTEVRSMIVWESLDSTLRLFCFQTLQGGDVVVSARKAPDAASIPFTFNLEVPAGGVPFTMETAGLTRV